MAFRELSVVEVREILRRWSRGDGLRTVAAATGADRKTIRRYVQAAMDHGLERGAEVEDELLALVIAQVTPGTSVEIGEMRALCRSHAGLIRAWIDAGCRAPKVARLLKRHTGVEPPERTLRRFISEELTDVARSSTVRVVDPPPGQVLEIDFMEVGRVWLGGKFQKLYALVCVAVVSRHMFVWPCLTMKRVDLIEGLEAAWRFFGGVFPVVVADNPKAIVSHADPLAPVFNEEFAEYSQARGFFLDLARVRRPQDKPRVERAIRYVRSDGFAGEKYLDLAHARAQQEHWCLEIAGRRRHGTTRRQPRLAFEADEQDKLLPAPTEPYDTPRWVDMTVGRDHAVVVAEALYSVPHRFRGEKMRVRFDRATVKMYHRRRLVKVHSRVAAGSSQIDPDDLPPGTAELATRDAEGLQERAAGQGEAVGEYARRLLEGDLPWTRMRHVYRLLGLCKRYGGARVEAACRKALDVDVVDITRINRMLERDLEGDPLPRPPRPHGQVLRPRFGRDPSEFRLHKRGEPHE